MRRRTAEQKSWLDRVLLAFMGPASIGDLHAPPTHVPTAEQSSCRRCGQPWDAHTVIRPAGKTIAQCPAPRGGDLP